MSTYEETKVQRHFLFRQDKWYGHLFDARLERNRIIVEGASACAIAAAMSGRAGNGKVAAIVSGGNIDLEKFAQLTVPAARSESV